MKRLLYLLFAMSTSSGHAFDLNVGQLFPSLTLPSIEDRTRRLSSDDFRGERWMLHLFASW